MINYLRCYFLLLCLAFTSLSARADYYDPPAWNTSDVSFTHQEWNFYTSANPDVPDITNNAYGTALFSISGATWFDTTAYSTTRTGMWAGLGVGTAIVTLDVPTPLDALRQQRVWVQVAIGCTATSALNMTASLTPYAGSSVTEVDERLYAMPSGELNGWYYEKMWNVNPAPTGCTITATMSFNGGAFDVIAFDEIDVDTINVPEPAGLSFGLFSTLLSIRLAALTGRRRCLS